MRRLACLSLIVAACNGGSSSNARVQLAWDFVVDGQITNVCGDVAMIELDVDGVVDTVACDAPVQTVDVGPGATSIQLTATDSDGYVLGVWSVSQNLGPGDLAIVNADIDLGDTLATTWTITQGGAAATCADVGAKYVQIVTAVPNASNDKIYDVFDCTDGAGVTAPLQLGTTYMFHAELLDASNQPLATTQAQPVDVSSDGQISLAPYDFTL